MEPSSYPLTELPSLDAWGRGMPAAAANTLSTIPSITEQSTPGPGAARTTPVLATRSVNLDRRSRQYPVNGYSTLDGAPLSTQSRWPAQEAAAAQLPLYPDPDTGDAVYDEINFDRLYRPSLVAKDPFEAAAAREVLSDPVLLSRSYRVAQSTFDFYESGLVSLEHRPARQQQQRRWRLLPCLSLRGGAAAPAASAAQAQPKLWAASQQDQQHEADTEQPEDAVGVPTAAAAAAAGPRRSESGRSRGRHSLSTFSVRCGSPPPAQLLPACRRSIWGLRVVSPFGRVSAVWSMVILLMDALYVALAMPLNAAFCPLLPGELTWCSSIDLAAGCIYAVNLVLGFQLGFVLECGYKRLVLMDGPLVARFYMVRGSSVSDAISVVPLILQVIVIGLRRQDYWLNRVSSFVMLLRLSRLGHLMHILFVDSIISSNTNKAMSWITRHVSVLTMYALVMLYTALVVVNFLACLAWLIASSEGFDRSWVSCVQWLNVPQANFWEQYLISFYWVFSTATSTGYGDISPKSIYDVLVSILCMLAGVSMVALLVGSMAEILTHATAGARRARMFREKLMEVNSWLARQRLPADLNRAIAHYYSEVWLQHTESPIEQRIWRELPSGLRAEIAVHLTGDILAGLDIFTDLGNDLREKVATRLVPVQVAPGHELCHEGDKGESLWVLTDGEMLALRHGHQVGRLAAPAVVDGSVLLAEEVVGCGVRPCTYRACTPCSLWQLAVKDLRALLAGHPDAAAAIHAAVRSSMVSQLSPASSSSRLAALGKSEPPLSRKSFFNRRTYGSSNAGAQGGPPFDAPSIHSAPAATGLGPAGSWGAGAAAPTDGATAQEQQLLLQQVLQGAAASGNLLQVLAEALQQAAATQQQASSTPANTSCGGVGAAGASRPASTMQHPLASNSNEAADAEAAATMLPAAAAAFECDDAAAAGATLAGTGSGNSRGGPPRLVPGPSPLPPQAPSRGTGSSREAHLRSLATRSTGYYRYYAT